MDGNGVNGLLATVTAMIFSGNFSFDKIVGTVLTFLIVNNFEMLKGWVLRLVTKNKKEQDYVSKDIIVTKSRYCDSKNGGGGARLTDDYSSDYCAYIISHVNKSAKLQLKGKIYNYTWDSEDFDFIEIYDFTNIFNTVDIKQSATINCSTTEKGTTLTQEFNISLRARTKNDIDEFLKMCKDEYNDDVSSRDKRYIYDYTNSKNLFSTNKCFDNLFFKEKGLLLDTINNFVGNKQEYIKLGIPYSLSIMLYGKPGCGKTSIIKSIAKYFNRDVIIINTDKNSKSSFREQVVENCYSGHLYVFEEIDCGAWKDIIKPRTSIELESSLKEKWLKEQGKSSFMITEQGKVEEDPELTLSDILNFMDGIIEYDGRVMIFTTNHIEHIDPALIRPGRIDLVLEIGNLTNEDVSNYYKLWFDKDIPETVLSKMISGTFSQAELGQLFACRDTEKILNRLVEGKV